MNVPPLTASHSDGPFLTPRRTETTSAGFQAYFSKLDRLRNNSSPGALQGKVKSDIRLDGGEGFSGHLDGGCWVSREEEKSGVNPDVGRLEVLTLQNGFVRGWPELSRPAAPAVLASGIRYQAPGSIALVIHAC